MSRGFFGKEFVYLWKAKGDDEIVYLPATGKEVLVMDMMGETETIKPVGGNVSVPEGINTNGFKLIGTKNSLAQIERNDRSSTII